MNWFKEEEHPRLSDVHETVIHDKRLSPHFERNILSPLTSSDPPKDIGEEIYQDLIGPSVILNVPEQGSLEFTRILGKQLSLTLLLTLDTPGPYFSFLHGVII